MKWAAIEIARADGLVDGAREGHAAFGGARLCVRPVRVSPLVAGPDELRTPLGPRTKSDGAVAFAVLVVGSPSARLQ